MLLLLLNLAAGGSSITGTGAGSLGLTGSGVGDVVVGAQGGGNIGLSGSGTGTVTPVGAVTGDAAGTLPLGGSAAGDVVVDAAGSGSVSLSGSAGGSVQDAAVVPTGYAVPTSADLKARYPAFAAVPDSTITYWIADAQRSVDTSWSSTDYAVALLALAAHNMALSGIGTDTVGVPTVPAGVTRMRSGSLDLSLTEAAANALVIGGFAATRYGQEYQMLLRRNRGGPIISDTGQVETIGWPVYPLGWL